MLYASHVLLLYAYESAVAKSVGFAAGQLRSDRSTGFSVFAVRFCAAPEKCVSILEGI